MAGGGAGKKCQLRQAQKCYPLEPVLEDSVAKVDEAPRKQGKQTKKKNSSSSRSVLSRLRDGYVKLMNEMALSADMTGVSAVYGCSTGQVDYPGTVAMASLRSAREEQEIEQVAHMAAFPTLQKQKL